MQMDWQAETMRRGETSVMSMGVAIAALVIFSIFFIVYYPTLRDTYSLFLSETNENAATLEHYDKLISELKKDNADTELLFTTNNDLVLVGFGKEQDSFSGYCGTTYFTKLKKPAKCEGKGCVCLCDSRIIGREMCNNEEDKCTIFEEDVKDSKSDCGIFVVANRRIANLNVKKDAGNIDINVLSSNRLR